MLQFYFKWLKASILTIAVMGCSAPSQGANETVANRQDTQIADEQYLTTLRDEFVEISGKDFVEFEKGSSVLGPTAEFRLERQAVWLRAYPTISVRLVAAGDGLDRIADRRLAIARGHAVQKHLIDVGVQTHQISGIDVAPSVRTGIGRVATKLDPIQAGQDE